MEENSLKKGSTWVGIAVTIAAASLLGWAFSNPKNVEREWDSFFKDNLDPVTESVIFPWLLWMITLMVLARLSILLGGYDSIYSLPRSRKQRTREGSWGLILSILSFGAVDSLALGDLFDEWSWLGAVIAVVLAVIAVCLLARWWASGRAIQVEAAKGSDPDKAAAGHVVALLEELGSENPRGIEAAQGPEISAMDSAALTAAPSNAFAAVALQLVNVLVPRAIWRARIDAEDEDHLTVSVSRNRRVKNTATIDRDALGLRVPLPTQGHEGQEVQEVQEGSTTANSKTNKVRYPDLHQMAAAVILTELVAAYDDIEDLDGATDWRSVGLHAIATADFKESPDQRALLAQAIEFDPANRLAQSASWYSRSRFSTDRRTLELYFDWLGNEIDREKRRKSPPALKDNPKEEIRKSAYRRRLKMNRALAALNRLFLEDAAGEVTKESGRQTSQRKFRENAQMAARELVKDLLEEKPEVLRDKTKKTRPIVPTDDPHGGHRLALEMWLNAASMYAIMEPPDGDPDNYRREALACVKDEDLPLSMRATYNRACYHATKHAKCEEVGSDDARRAVALLTVSDDYPAFRKWRQRDPQLAELRRTEEYKKAFLDDPHDGLSYLKPFSCYEEKLAAAGLQDPQAFRERAKAQPRSVARLLETDLLVIRRLSGIADLALTLRTKAPEDSECKRCHLEICAALVDDGHESWSNNWDDKLATKLSETLGTRLKTAPDEEQIAKLLNIKRQGNRASTQSQR